MVGQDDSASRHVLLHEVDKVVVHLALDLVENGNASGPTVHTECPSNLLGELSTEVPSPSTNFCLVDLDWPSQLDERQDACVHVVMTCLAKEEKLLLKRVTPTAHVSCHFGCSAADPHR